MLLSDLFGAKIVFVEPIDFVLMPQKNSDTDQINNNYPSSDNS